MDCEEVRAMAPELALGVASGEERAAALAHLADCVECRQELERLSRTSDELLSLTAEHEPPVGFESAVLARLIPDESQPRQRRRMVALVAAMAIGALAMGGSLLVAFRDDVNLAHEYRATLAEGGGKELRAARLYGPGKQNRGVAFFYDGSPSWAFVTVRRAWAAEGYRGELVLKGGRRISLGDFKLDPHTGSWGGTIPVSPQSVSELRLLGNERGDVLEAALDKASFD